MTREEYLAQRNELLNEAQEAINNNDLEGAKKIKDSVEALDKEFAELEAAAAEVMENKAEIQALENQTEMPEIIIHETNMEETNMEERIYDASSVEYKNAWLKEMARNARGDYLVGTPTKEEENAYTFTTANTGSVVPTEVLNRIIELVPSMAPLYADATPSGMTSGFGVPRHKATNAGDAAVTNEGVANDDERDTFDLLPIDGVEIKKHINITRKMSFQSVDAFEDWIVSHLAARIAVAKESRILTQLNDATYGIASANKLTGQSYTDAALRHAFALIKAGGAKAVYANNATIWDNLFNIQDGEDRQLFIPSSMDDPITQGRIYGAPVKQDENIPDDTVYIGVPARILANDFDKLTTARDMDVKSWVTTISAYSLFDAGLEDPLAFVKMSF